ncbi:putative type-4 ice-structuring protein-like [Scophthalmus maximus]|uniref:Putative type-4 ice-structuring protein-like n=1 Tax=Scophthalmus maximus TaxID=52904 RepID=A0A2U9CZM5_SCOMX|nr:type-4 ice-structuring protein [Scophthalmus maximus]AWP21593.1 putative type-4 ice-structuring protein-like [Scophthalmus maximus]KAF0024492.1 hypothetical protein F2P81_023294 [Scophthalmus maximus]
MKFTLIAAVVVLALAQGSFAQDAADLEKLGQFFEDLKNKITLEVTELIQSQDLANQAQTYMEDRKTQLEPLAAQVQEQLRTAAAKMEEHVKPLTDNMQPMVEKLQKQLEALFQGLTDQARAIGN